MIFLRYSRTLIEANCYILADSPGSPALVVDPGAGSAAWIDQTLQRKGLSLGAVLCTHGHMDHVWDSGLVAGEAPVFIPGPDLYCMDDPVAYARPLGSTFEAASGHGWIKPEGTRALPGEFFADGGAEIVPGVAIRALPAPGHTEGSSVFLLNGAVDPDRESAAFPEGVAGQALMLSGDVLFRDGVAGRTSTEAIPRRPPRPCGPSCASSTPRRCSSRGTARLPPSGANGPTLTICDRRWPSVRGRSSYTPASCGQGHAPGGSRHG